MLGTFRAIICPKTPEIEGARNFSLVPTFWQKMTFSTFAPDLSGKPCSAAAERLDPR
jgi:hypothetical protein